MHMLPGPEYLHSMAHLLSLSLVGRARLGKNENGRGVQQNTTKILLAWDALAIWLLLPF